MAFQMQASVPELMDVARREPRARSNSTAASRATARSPPTACSPGGWPSAACGSSSSTTTTGTTTAACKEGIALQGRGDRPRLHGADHRPQAARHARRHADRLGRRVRPHAHVAEAATAATITTRPCPSGWPARGIRGGIVLRRDRRPRLRRRRERRAPSTTCTPRCCTSSASTTTRSASSSRASTPGSPAWKDAGCQRHPRLNATSVVAVRSWQGQ